jgi:hypothetical protein
MIQEQEARDYSQYYKHITSWSGVISTIIFLLFLVAVAVVKGIEHYGLKYGIDGHQNNV